MGINYDIYGQPETWRNSLYLSTGRMKAKCANFTGATDLSGATLAAGNTANKTPHNELIDRSISCSALGTESLYSHICYVNGSDIYTDNENVTEFYFAESAYPVDGANVESGHNYIYNEQPYNQWKTYSAGGGGNANYSAATIPIVELNPKKILYLLEVLACKADGTPNISGGVAVWTFIDNYVNNTGGVKTNFPYIMAARLSPRIDNGATTTQRTQLSDIDALFGICINREFTALPNDDIKINYAIFRSMTTNCILIYGSVGRQPYDSDFYNLLLCDENDIEKDTGSGLVWAQHEYSDTFKEFLIQQAACFGVYFRVTLTGGSAATLPLNSDSVYLGLLDDYGIGHGVYTRGADNETNPIWNYDSYSQSPYDYHVTPDPNTYSNTTTFNNIGGLSTMFKRYVLNAAGVAALGGDLFKIGDDIVVDQSGSYQDYQSIVLNDFLTNNPIDAIISLKKYPLSNIPHDEISEQLKLGKKTIQTIGYNMPYNSFMYLFKPVEIFPRFGNSFLDYSPFTSIQLYIPFCGTIDLNPADVMGKTVDVQLLIDFTTGSCDAFISVGNLVIKTASGTCAIDIPVTGTESATVDAQITNGIIQGKAARGKATTDFATANFSPSGWFNNITNPFGVAQNRFENKLNRAQSEYNVEHTQTPLRTIGTCTPVGGWAIDFKCRLIITYPTGNIIDNAVPPRFNNAELEKYGHITGFATLDNAPLSKYAGGLVVADNINLDGVTATDEEKQLIIAAVKEGCYL